MIAHELAGAGPPVVLLHSTACDRRMWAPQVAALTAAGHRVLTCDLRGFGESPPATAPYNNAADVLALLERVLRGGTVDLVGSSGGGGVALEIAARWPHRVRRLLLLAPDAPGYQPDADLRAFGGSERALLEAGDLDGAVDLNVRTWLGPSAGAEARSALTRMQRRAFDLQADAPDVAYLEEEFELTAVSAPTLIVSGAFDLGYFRALARDLAARLPDARLAELDWAGHLPALERPAEIGDLLVRWCAQPA